MRKSIAIVVCMILAAVLIFAGCDQSLRAELYEENNTSVSKSVQSADASLETAPKINDVELVKVPELIEASESEINNTDIAAVDKKDREKPEPKPEDKKDSLIAGKPDSLIAEKEDSLIAEKDVEETEYYGRIWDRPDEMEIETLPEGYDQITIRDDNILSSFYFPVFISDDGNQMIAYSRVLDENDEVTDDSGWAEFIYSGGIAFRDPIDEELDEYPIPDGYFIPTTAGFGVYAVENEDADAEEPEDYEPSIKSGKNDEAEKSLDASEDKAEEEILDEALAEMEGLSLLAFGDKYDEETGEVIETGWFEVEWADREIDADSLEYLIDGQTINCIKGEEELTVFEVGIDDTSSIFDKKGDSEYYAIFVNSIEACEDTEDTPDEGIEYEFVIDVPAYSYSEPVYRTNWIAVCDDCKTEISGDIDAHLKEEIENGGKGSYHNEPIQEKVGSRTIDVPEAGHYEIVGE